MTLWPCAWQTDKEFEAQEMMRYEAYRAGHLWPTLSCQWLPPGSGSADSPWASLTWLRETTPGLLVKRPTLELRKA